MFLTVIGKEEEESISEEELKGDSTSAVIIVLWKLHWLANVLF